MHNEDKQNQMNTQVSTIIEDDIHEDADVCHLCPLIPNEETIASFLEGRNGSLPRFKTVKELMDDLLSEDTE